jgi:predicted transcriptional regulator
MKDYEKLALSLFSEAIKMGMEEREIGINKLAELTELSKNSIYKVLRGENYEITVLIKIMRQLKIHLEFSLMSESNNIHTMGGDSPSLN